jgi:hypothetical protein
MPQFVRTNIDINNYLQDVESEYVEEFWNYMEQRAQVTYNNERVIVIDWHRPSHRVFVQNGPLEYFFLSSPDIEDITIRDVLEYLGCNTRYAKLEWCETSRNIENILDTPVETVELHQATIVPPTEQQRRENESIVHLITVDLN